MKTDMHENSLAAYAEELPKLSKRAGEIFEYLKDWKLPITDRQVMEQMGFSEPNAVRPRITELIKIGLVEEVGCVKCHRTGKKVRLINVHRQEVQIPLALSTE